MKLSARNQLTAKVVAVNEGVVTSTVELDVGGQRLVASITAEAARELELSEGMDVTAIIKASDVIVGA
jgi:molybdopterin-binding protein